MDYKTLWYTLKKMLLEEDISATKDSLKAILKEMEELEVINYFGKNKKT